MTNAQLIPVPFYDDTLVLADESGTPHVVMKPIVENMGLSWPTQTVKLTEKFGATVSIIETVAEDGKLREMVCLPLRKLPAWLYSINPNKVNPELREKVVRYQDECDDALWAYWTEGAANRPGSLNVPHILATQREARKLMQTLKKETVPAIRQALHAQLEQLCRLLGQPTPALEAIGQDAPAEPPLVGEFWNAYNQLIAAGAKVNHSRNPQLIAINLHHIAEVARKYGVRLASWTELRGVLRRSLNPRFIDTRGVNSLITGSSSKCWVFEAAVQ